MFFLMKPTDHMRNCGFFDSEVSSGSCFVNFQRSVALSTKKPLVSFFSNISSCSILLAAVDGRDLAVVMVVVVVVVEEEGEEEEEEEEDNEIESKSLVEISRFLPQVCPNP